MKKIIILALSVILCLCFAGCGETSETLFRDAQEKFDGQDWEAAITLAKSVTEKYSDSDEAELAKELIEQAELQIYLKEASEQYANAEEEKSAGNLDAAIAVAESLSTNYPDAPEAAMAENLIMNCNAEKDYAAALLVKDSGDTEKVLSALDKVVKKYPNADVLDSAKAELKAVKEIRSKELLVVIQKYYEEQNWDKVIEQSQALLSLIATSEEAKEARRFFQAATEAKQEKRRLELLEGLNSAYAKQDWDLVKKVSETLLTDYKDFEERDTVSQYLATANANLKEIEKAKTRQIIVVTRVDFSMNSAGGAELHFNFVNNSDKTVKYLTFGVKFYNAVGDIVIPNYDRKIINYGRVTGPYAKGQGVYGTNWYWGPYYSWDIKTVELVSLEIEYMDKSKISLTPEQIKYVQ